MAPDPESLIYLGGAVAFGQDVAKRVLGKTFDRIGDSVDSLSVKGVQNVREVFSKADRRIGSDPPDGDVPPKVLRSVLDEAVVADDELTKDYLAGVLASSRTENGRDDRAAAYARLVGDLSTYTLRTHYLFYASLQRLASGTDVDAIRMGRLGGAVYMRADEYNAGMAFSEGEDRILGALVLDTLQSLSRHGFIGDSFGFAEATTLRDNYGHQFPQEGFVWTPTSAGIVFFAAACGITGDPTAAWVGDPSAFAMESGPSLPAVHRVESLPASQGLSVSA